MDHFKKCNCHEEHVAPLFSCEQFKVLKVIGRKTAQVVSDTVDQLDHPAREILSINFVLAETQDSAFMNKVVKQGIIRKHVVYCDVDGIVRCQTIDIPFTAVFDIPGVDPHLELEFQNRLVHQETDFRLIDCRTLAEKVVFDVEVVVSTWVERKLRVCNTSVLHSYQVCR